MTMSRRTLLGTTAATTLLGALGLAGCTTSSGASSSSDHASVLVARATRGLRGRGRGSRASFTPAL